MGSLHEASGHGGAPGPPGGLVVSANGYSLEASRTAPEPGRGETFGARILDAGARWATSRSKLHAVALLHLGDAPEQPLEPLVVRLGRPHVDEGREGVPELPRVHLGPVPGYDAGLLHLLWRYWRAFSDKPPPPGLKALLDRVFSGEGLYLYVH